MWSHWPVSVNILLRWKMLKEKKKKRLKITSFASQSRKENLKLICLQVWDNCRNIKNPLPKWLWEMLNKHITYMPEIYFSSVRFSIKHFVAYNTIKLSLRTDSEMNKLWRVGKKTNQFLMRIRLYITRQISQNFTSMITDT